MKKISLSAILEIISSSLFVYSLWFATDAYSAIIGLAVSYIILSWSKAAFKYKNNKIKSIKAEIKYRGHRYNEI